MYTPTEAVKILVDAPATPHGARRLTIRDWINRGWIQCHERTMRRRFQRYRKSPELPVPDWGDRGRKRDMTDEEVAGAAQKFEATHGAGAEMEDKHVEEVIMEHRKQRRLLGGRSGVGGKTKPRPSRKQLRNTKARLLALARASMPVAVENKTVARWTALRSIRHALCHALSSIASIMMVGVTSGGKPSSSPAAKMVSQCFGDASVTAVVPALMTSTDDCGFYKTDGMMRSEKPEWMPVTFGTENTGVSSVCNHKPSATAIFNGVTVKLTVTTTADGEVAPFFVTAGGLNRDELCPEACPSGVLIVPVEGLDVAGDPDGNSVGYVCLIRKAAEGTVVGTTPETVLHDFYIRNVHWPFIAKRRKLVDPSWDPANGVPDHLSSIAFGDGAGTLMQAKTAESIQATHADIKITDVKHGAAATGGQQPTDTARTFALLHQTNGITTAASVTQIAIKSNVIKALSKDAAVNLASPKIKAVADFAATLPENMRRAAPAKTVRDGWRVTKMLGDQNESGTTDPSFEDMVSAVCQRPLTVEEWNDPVNGGDPSAPPGLVQQHRQELLRIMCDQGEVTEAEFDSRGFAPDTDPDGKVVLRENSVSGENRQRSKILSARPQRAQRVARITKALLALNQKQDTVRAKYQRVLDDNILAEKELLVDQMGKPNPSVSLVFAARNQRQIASWLRDASVPNFAKVNAPLLKQFITARTSTTGKGPKGGWAKKMSEQEAVPGANTLIRQAYDLRQHLLTMKRLPPTVDLVAAILPAPTVRSVAGTASSGRRASEYLADVGWCQLVDATLTGAKTDHVPDTDRADQLQLKLLSRLPSHITSRVASASKHDHWVWDWVVLALGAVAAVMELFGHVKADMGAAGPDRSLYADVSHFTTVAEDNGHLSGAYAHYDTAEREFVRAGKVVRFGELGGFSVRGAEHKKCSMLKTAADVDSHFYSSYPDKAAGGASLIGRARRGYSNNLVQLMLVGFDARDQTVVDGLASDDLFRWPADVVEKVDKIEFPGCTTTSDKQLHMVGYLLEMAYDLALKPSANVSRSPGFETALGIFGGNSD